MNCELGGIRRAHPLGMARRREEEAGRLLERGTIEFVYRPRVETYQPEGVEDVQRLLVVLSPEGRRRFRVIAVGRKTMPSSASRDRFWGFVDLVLDSQQDLQAALAAQTYGTKTRGIRHLPAARSAARGTYKLEWHDGHAHFTWELAHINEEDEVIRDLGLEKRGDVIVTVANPDPAAWGLTELPPLQLELFDEVEVHVTLPTPFPPVLQSRFEDRRFIQLETTELLDHPGAELVFIAGGVDSRAKRRPSDDPRDGRERHRRQ